MYKFTQKDLKRFWDKVDTTGDCWEWIAGKNSYGYGKFKLNGKSVHASRLSYFLRYGAFDKHQHVCHHCDNPGCVNPEHLFLGSNADNMADAQRKGRYKGREANFKGKVPNRKLNPEKVHKIRDMISQGIPNTEIAKHMGVSRNMIGYIKNGSSWADV